MNLILREMEMMKHRGTAKTHVGVVEIHVCLGVHEPMLEDHHHHHHRLLMMTHYCLQIVVDPPASAAWPMVAPLVRKVMTNRMWSARRRLMEGLRSLEEKDLRVMLVVEPVVVMEAPKLLGVLVSMRARLVNSPPAHTIYQNYKKK